LEGFQLQIGGGIAAWRLGAHSGRRGGRDDEGGLACLEATGRGGWAALAIELDPWLEFFFSNLVFGF